VTRANQSIAEFGPIFEALGMDGGVDHDRIEASMAARCDATPAGEAQREALRKAIDFKVYEFDCHGVEMNQRYASGAVVTDGQSPRRRMPTWSCTTSPPPGPARGCRMPGSMTGAGASIRRWTCAARVSSRC
jgi:2,4-dichlorophenol 6-monooxygenase